MLSTNIKQEINHPQKRNHICGDGTYGTMKYDPCVVKIGIVVSIPHPPDCLDAVGLCLGVGGGGGGGQGAGAQPGHLRPRGRGVRGGQALGRAAAAAALDKSLVTLMRCRG